MEWIFKNCSNKIILKKLLSLVLSLVFMCSALAGCGNTDDNPSEESSEGAVESTAEVIEPLNFVTEGKSDYVFMIAADIYSNDEIKELITKINKALKERTGVSLSIKSDAKYTDDDAGIPAILVGNTKFKETAQTASEMRNKDFYVGMSGNKIILYGYTVEGTVNALAYFYNKVVLTQKSADKTMQFTEEHMYTSNMSYGIESILCCGTELKDYRIVVPKNASVHETLVANTLRYHLVNNYGYDFAIVDDTVAETANEILIGETSRSTVTPAKNQFTVTAKGGKLEIKGGDLRGYEALFDYLTGTLFASSTDKKYTYDDGFSYTGTASNTLTDGTNLVDGKLGDIRVMFYNVYGWIGYGPNDVRHELQRDMLKAYDADVICFQEYADYYHADFTKLVTELGYADASTQTSYINNTPLFYKTESLELVKSGCLLFSGPNNANTKSLTWAVLKEKATGDMFVAMSTHLMYDMKGLEDPNAVRVSNVNEILSLISTEIDGNDSYKDLPLIVGGDLNCNISTKPHSIFKAGGLTRAWDIAASKNDSKGLHSWSIWDETYDTWVQVPEINGDNTKSIDHAYVSSGTVVKAYAAVTSLYAHWVSDHMPLIVDINI